MAAKNFPNIDFFKIKTNNVSPKAGRLLIADPFASDFYFTRSVILLLEYSPQTGALGLILNKPVDKQDIPVELYNKIEKDKLPGVYYGGPVSQNQLFYIHPLPNIILDNSFPVMKGLYWGGNFDELVRLINQDAVSRNEVKFFVGYSGWAPGQLESEIRRNFWVVAETNANEIFGDTSNLWKEKLLQLGLPYAIWTKYSTNPELN